MRNWKTTTLGLLAGLTVLIPQIQSYIDGKPVNWPNVLFAVVVAVLGANTRDSGSGSDARGGPIELGLRTQPSPEPIDPNKPELHLPLTLR